MTDLYNEEKPTQPDRCPPDEHATDYICASKAYADYAFPRSALRELSEVGKIGMRVKKLFGGRVMKLYNRADIERYLNEQ